MSQLEAEPRQKTGGRQHGAKGKATIGDLQEAFDQVRSLLASYAPRGTKVLLSLEELKGYGWSIKPHPESDVRLFTYLGPTKLAALYTLEGMRHGLVAALAITVSA
tara:strand:- start:652 stop:969 length:318 start_codon:yes stop_codon:yes gene_type:complete